MLAAHGFELATIAERSGAQLFFEAAVGGGIPVIKTLRESLAGNAIQRVSGILNGTCNYILSRMETEHLPFEVCLSEAQRLGYAEADPTFDVGGFDTAHKLAILASLAFGAKIDAGAVSVEGIETITLADLSAADELGFRIKLLGVAERTAHGVEQRVHPTMVAKSAPLAQTMGVLNAVSIDGDAVGELTLVGPGAGGDATASAVAADIVDIARGIRVPPFGRPAASLVEADRVPMQRHEGGYYVRLAVVDRPGAMGAIAARMGEQLISLEAIMQKRATKEAAAAGSRAGRADDLRHDRSRRSGRLLRELSKMGSCARGRRLFASNAKRSEVASSTSLQTASRRRRGPPHAGSRDRAHVRHDGLLHRAGHVRQMAERLVADRTDRMGALRRGVADRAHRVAISVAAGHATFEASSTAAVAFRLALLFDDRERVCRPRAPAVGDCDDLVSHAGLRGSSCRTCAGRKSERGTDDRNRARISRRGDRDAPGSRARFSRSFLSLSRALSAIRYTCWPPASSLARTPPRRRSRGRKSPASCFLTPILPWVWKQPGSVGVWAVMAVMGVFGATSHGMLIVAHRYAPAPTLTPVYLHPAHLDDHFGRAGFWRLARRRHARRGGLVVACGAYLALRERRGRGSRSQRLASIDETS